MVSTLTSGYLLFVTGNGAGGVSVAARHFGMTRGVSIDRTRMWVAGDARLFHLVNRGPHTIDGVAHDAVYVPQRGYFLSNCLVHDVVHSVSLGGEHHEVVFVNTGFSTLATVDDEHTFRPLWTPRHVSRLAAEDRCHLNCVGVRDGEVWCASVFSFTDSREGWRAVPRGSGALIDIATQDVLCHGLSKPHSVRWHRDRWWLLDSEAGKFGYVDERHGQFVEVSHLGNFLRGLCLVGDYAIIGASPLRGQPFAHEVKISGLAKETGLHTMAALYVVDLRSGQVVHALTMSGIFGVYDAEFVAGPVRSLVTSLDGPSKYAELTSIAPGTSAPADAVGALHPYSNSNFNRG